MADQERAQRTTRAGEGQLLLSLLCTYLGSAITATAVTIFLVQEFGVGASTGVALILQLIPNLLLGPVGGEVITRVNPKHAAMASSLGTGVVVLGYTVAQQAWQAQLLSLVVGLVAVVGIPARMALRACVLTPERLKASTGAIVAAERLGLVLGPLVASVVAVTINVQAAFVLEFLLGLVATVSLLRLDPVADNRDTPHGNVWDSYRRAWQLMRSSRVVWEYSLTGFTYSVGTGIRRLLFPAVLVVTLRSSESHLGLLVGAMALGGIIGGFLAPRIGAAYIDRHYVLQAGVEVISWLILAVVSNLAGYIAVVFVAGAFEGSTTALYFVRVQQLLKPKELGRYFSLMSPLTDACIAVGVLVASALGMSQLADRGALVIALLIGIPFLVCRIIVRGALGQRLEQV
jgi:MFS family permease